MVTVEFLTWRGKVDWLSGQVTRETKDGIYILSSGKEYCVARSCILDIYCLTTSEKE